MSAALKPTEKVQAGAYAGAAVVVLIWVAGLLGVDMPAEIAGALVVLISAPVAWLKTDGAGWFKGTGKRRA